jgi:hypothetical protein
MMPITNNHTNAKETALSMLIRQSGLSFLVYESSTGEVKELKHFTFENEVSTEKLHEAVKAKLSESGILDRSFFKVSVCVSNSLSAFVPRPLFDDTKMDSYLKHHVDLRPTDFITYDNIEAIDAVNVYVPFVNVNNMLLDAFGRFSYFHASSVLAHSVLSNPVKNHKMIWSLHIEAGIAYCLVFKNERLEFYNAFSWKNETDLLYYTLAVRKSHKLSKSTLWLSGRTSENDAFQKLISEYHEYFDVLATNSDLSHKNLSLLHPHQHLLLFQTPACVS